MIKSTKVSLRFANIGKKASIQHFIDEYSVICQRIVDILWKNDKVCRFIDKATLSDINTWISKRALQCCAKQASAIVRGTRVKQERRQFVYEKLLSEGKFKKARKLKKIIDEATISCPKLKSVSPELDQRFVKTDLGDKTSFDGWVTLGSLGDKLKIVIPFKKTKHFNKMIASGSLKHGLRLSNNFLTFMFDIADKQIRDTGKTVGIDIGANNLFVSSDGQQSTKDKHGWDLRLIQEKIALKKKGSKAFRKAQIHRTNFINWSINQFNFDGVKTIRLENIKNLRKRRRSSRYLSHWTYTGIFGKISDSCRKLGVQVEQVSPVYTSQRCSQCGWVRNSNRKGSVFKCTSCGHTLGADLNASNNIAIELPEIRRKQRLAKGNLKGFFWLSKEHIVPCTSNQYS